MDPVFGCITGKRDEHADVWRRINGPLPDGKIIYRMCRKQDCCALHHLELVTKSELEKLKSWAYRVRRTHCPAGHDLATNAAITPQSGRTCRTCNRAALDAAGVPRP